MKKHLLKIVYVLFPLFTITAQAFGQNVVKGRVTDPENLPLIGVTVAIKNATTATSTDLDGNYSISVGEKQTLTFHYMGFITKDVIVGSRAIIDVQMAYESMTLDAVEVVSIGYGTSNRRDLTGSITKADIGTIMKSNVTSFDKALGGRIAGVVVTTADGALGSEASITIRGNNSLTQSSAPLFIIDGFPTESSFAASINPADIESMDVLKDASSTAIYGARGANGVIVITTKEGREGKPVVNFSASFTGNQIANKIDLMNPYEFVRLQSELIDDSSYFDDDRTLDYYSSKEGYDWQDEVYRKGFTQNYNISLSGGNKDTKYSVSFSALDQDGIILNSNFQRYQGKINLSQKITKKLDLNLNANYSNSTTNGSTPTDAQAGHSSSGWLIYSVWGYRPISPNEDDDLLGDIIDSEIDTSKDYRFNPVKTVTNEHRKTVVDYLRASAALTYTIIPDLKLRSTGAYTMNKRRREAFNNSQTYTGFAGSSSGKGVNGAITWMSQAGWLNENILTYKKKIAKNHNLDFLAGITFQGETNTLDGIEATQVTSESLGLAGLYTGTQQTVTPVYNSWTMMSGLFRLNYNYKYKYYLTASFRADGSSKFPNGNKWGNFPSIGASWNFNREGFLKNIDWISNGKLRASWGLTGNNRTRTPYDYHSQITVTPGSQNSYDYVFSGENVLGYYVNNLFNDELKWETTEQYNIGLDFGAFDGRIKISADVYLKNTRDLLLHAVIPASTGFTTATMNIGEVQNKGFEFSLETLNIATPSFQWSSTFNIGINRNKIVSLTEGEKQIYSTIGWDTSYNTQEAYVSAVGMPTGMMYGYIYEGTYKDNDFNGQTLKSGVPHLSSINRDIIQRGDPKYKDINGDGIVDDDDKTIIGCGQPLHTGGLGNTFTYKNIDLNIFMYWSYGNDVINANRLVFESGIKANTNQLASFSDRWSQTNRESDIPRSKSNGAEVYSTRVVEDASFLRIGNISLGYTFPKVVLRKLRINTIRLYVSADNIYTFTNYSGPDPEVSTKGSSVLTPGFDWSAYPRTIGFTIGTNITF